MRINAEYGSKPKTLIEALFSRSPGHLNPEMGGGPADGSTALLSRGTPSPMPVPVAGQGTLPSMAEMEGNRDKYLKEGYAEPEKPGAMFDARSQTLPALGLGILAMILGAKGKHVGAALGGYSKGVANRYQQNIQAKKEADENRSRLALAHAGIEGDRIAARVRYNEKEADRDLARTEAARGELREDRQVAEARAFQEKMAGQRFDSAEDIAARKSRDTQAKNYETLLRDAELSDGERAEGLGLAAEYRTGSLAPAGYQRMVELAARKSYKNKNIDSQVAGRDVMTKWNQAQYREFEKNAPAMAQKLSETIQGIIANTRLTNARADIVIKEAAAFGPKMAAQAAATLAKIAEKGEASPADLKSLITLLEQNEKELNVVMEINPFAAIASGAPDELARVRSQLAEYRKKLKERLLTKVNGGAPGGGGGGRPANLPGSLPGGEVPPMLPGGMPGEATDWSSLGMGVASGASVGSRAKAKAAKGGTGPKSNVKAVGAETLKGWGRAK